MDHTLTPLLLSKSTHGRLFLRSTPLPYTTKAPTTTQTRHWSGGEMASGKRRRSSGARAQKNHTPHNGTPPFIHPSVPFKTVTARRFCGRTESPNRPSAKIPTTMAYRQPSPALVYKSHNLACQLAPTRSWKPNAEEICKPQQQQQQPSCSPPRSLTCLSDNNT